MIFIMSLRNLDIVMTIFPSFYGKYADNTIVWDAFKKATKMFRVPVYKIKRILFVPGNKPDQKEIKLHLKLFKC